MVRLRLCMATALIRLGRWIMPRGHPVGLFWRDLTKFGRSMQEHEIQKKQP